MKTSSDITSPHQHAAASPDPGLHAAVADLREALRASESQRAILQGALRALPDGVVCVDVHGRIVQLSLGAAHMIGWTEAQALGRPLHEVLQLRDANGRAVDVLGADSKHGHDVTSLVRRDRHVVLVDVMFAPILGHAHATIGHAGGDPAPGGHSSSTHSSSTHSSSTHSSSTQSSGTQWPGQVPAGDLSALDPTREVLGAVVTFRNVTAAKRINDELTYHATHDPLTGAGNRRAFEMRLQRAVAKATTRHIPHVLLYLDLDRFKAVNDSGGHVAGDELLRQLTVLLKRHLRDHDTLARLGGDEFAILLENCAPAQATNVAERIRTAVLGARLHWHGQTLGVGISIGQVNFSDDTLTPQQLLQRADEMCYQAKSHGRNRVSVDPPLNAPSKAGRRATDLQPAKRVGGTARG